MPRKLLDDDEVVTILGRRHIVFLRGRYGFLSAGGENRASAKQLVGNDEAFELAARLYYGHRSIGDWPTAKAPDLTRFVYFLENLEKLKALYATEVTPTAASSSPLSPTLEELTRQGYQGYQTIQIQDEVIFAADSSDYAVQLRQLADQAFGRSQRSTEP